jgi:hypothetical protein
LSYIGTPPSNAFTSLLKQDFSTSATTGYTLDHAVNNANDIALFINFVRQEPTAGYAASGTSLVLTSATASSDDMYCVYLGQALQTVNPANASVGSSQLSPTAITGQTALTSVASDDTVLISDTSASGALKKMTRANFVSGIGGANTPAFYAQGASDQGWSDDATAKIIFGTEVYDTDNTFASSRFTPGVAGTYKIYCGIQVGTDSTAYGAVDHCRLQLYKNGSVLIRADYDSRGSDTGNGFVSFTLNGNWSVVADDNDYYEIYVYADVESSTPETKFVEGGVNFGAYKLIT